MRRLAGFFPESAVRLGATAAVVFAVALSGACRLELPASVGTTSEEVAPPFGSAPEPAPRIAAETPAFPPSPADEQILGPLDQQVDAPSLPSEEVPEVLTRGPVHEAFAEPVNFQPQQGLVATREPPPDIDEVPPDEAPEGEGYVWVPGYWAWDADRSAYIWVSGCWRLAPPGMEWVPGYWTPVTTGWQWGSGYWSPTDEEIVYLPTPPQFYDMEPPGPPPSLDSIWIPPCDYWYDGGYVLRPGYWLASVPDWIFVPSHYVWTPFGYVFVSAYWDYPLERRGVLFAPVYIPRSAYLRPGFVYSPGVCVVLEVLTIDLFIYPRYCHYYFGDYYDDVYLRRGIHPWCDADRARSWYDPIYVHSRWRHRRTDTHWEDDRRHDYDLRRSHKDLRPPRTYREMEARRGGGPGSQRGGPPSVRRLSEVVGDKAAPLRFGSVNREARTEIARQARDRQNRQRQSQRQGRRPGVEREAIGRQGSAQAQPQAPERQRRQQPGPPVAVRQERQMPPAERQAAGEREAPGQRRPEEQPRGGGAERAAAERQRPQREAPSEQARQARQNDLEATRERDAERRAREQRQGAGEQKPQAETPFERARQERQAQQEERMTGLEQEVARRQREAQERRQGAGQQRRQEEAPVEQTAQERQAQQDAEQARKEREAAQRQAREQERRDRDQQDEADRRRRQQEASSEQGRQEWQARQDDREARRERQAAQQQAADEERRARDQQEAADRQRRQQEAASRRPQQERQARQDDRQAERERQAAEQQAREQQRRDRERQAEADRQRRQEDDGSARDQRARR